MLMASLLALVLSAQSPAVQTVNLRPMAAGTDKSKLLERLQSPPAQHRLHAHIGPDGRTVIGCSLSHRQVPDLRPLLRGSQVRP